MKVTGSLTSEKLHAVPLGAFHPDCEGTSLILKADKDELERAEGFDKNNWRSLGTTAWGAEPFWKDNPDQQNKAAPNTPTEPKETQPHTQP